MFSKILSYALNHSKWIIGAVIVCVVLSLTQLPRITVDTDPENMLPDDAPARVFHRELKEEFAIYDMIVLGITNESHPDGVFNVETLNTVYTVTKKIQQIPGVIAREVIAFSTKDNIEQDGIGAVRFDWLMASVISTQAEALAIREKAQSHPMFEGSVVSDNGQALAVYIPIERKNLSYAIAEQIRAICQQSLSQEQYYITGLPVANDQFGVEMFKQMAISAPLAGLVIFLLMWWFFKSLVLIVAPMILAVATVMITMGLLIAFGFPVHIMSSMIPIFLMPIAVLDSVHILSEFSDHYPVFRDKRKTVLFVMGELFKPMLFTSLTSIAGFFSLSFSPIPPVQVFGIFVALGVAVAWVLTMVFIPAYIMLMNERSFEAVHAEPGETHKTTALDAILVFMKKGVLKYARLTLVVCVGIAGISIYGISRIQVNDNPVRWFSRQHPIRVADQVLNKHFAGTYEAYLVLEADDRGTEIFLEPEMLRYIDRLQTHMMASGRVGKATSLSDIVKKVYYELLGGDVRYNVIPDTKEAVAQCLISFENSHKPDDLWHMTTPDYAKVNIWIQLKSGDNKDMAQVVKALEQYMQDNPPPFRIRTGWAGLTYINVVWQNNMVVGMLNNFLGSFIIVLFMMLFLFRSPVKALISMIPLTLTILLIYSLLGFFGKDYDMPVAVLSALTLGLSVDFAIHFIQRASEIYQTAGSWDKTVDEMFGGPGRAIVRNALVVAIGFLPLLVAPLIPYRTVGFFMFAIMAVSSLATMIILPAILTLIPNRIFSAQPCPFACRTGSCILVGIFVAAAVAYLVSGYTTAGWQVSTLSSIVVVGVFSAVCHGVSQRSECRTKKEDPHA